MRVDCTCKTCGKVFTETPYRAARGWGKFCSWSCRITPRAGVVRDDGVVMVPVSSGEFALVDPEDAEAVLRHNWHIDASGYAATAIASPTGQKIVKMHRMLMGEPPEVALTVDHCDRNRLNNRRSNLRWATRSQQAANTKIRQSKSGFKGVSPHHYKWRAAICVEGKQRHLGLFHTPEDAARVYDAAAIEAWGDSASLNFPAE